MPVPFFFALTCEAGVVDFVDLGEFEDTQKPQHHIDLWVGDGINFTDKEGEYSHQINESPPRKDIGKRFWGGIYSQDIFNGKDGDGKFLNPIEQGGVLQKPPQSINRIDRNNGQREHNQKGNHPIDHFRRRGVGRMQTVKARFAKARHLGYNITQE